MTTLFMILAVAWILFCAVMLMGILIVIVENPTKVKGGVTILITLLLFIGISWGFDRVDEIKGAMDRESTSQTQSE